MKRLLFFVIGAVVMELFAMQVMVMHLPSQASVVFGILAALLVFFALWEKPKPDERDQSITWRSSHIAFLTVSTVLTGFLMYQTVSRAVDLWTLAAVAAVVVGKIIGRLISERTH